MKKILSLLFLPLLLVACNTNEASNSTSSKVSSSYSSTTPIDSSSESSFVKKEGYIYDEQDLINIKNNLNGTYYLANDIVLNNKWSTIGDKENPFTGSINGNGHSIKNLIIDSSLTMTEETSTLGRDLISVGGFIGYLKGSINNLRIENYKITLSNQLPSVSNYNSTTTEYKIFVGALVGINKGTITDCYSNGEIDVTSKCNIARGRIGGLVGKNESILTSSSTSGKIKANFTHENIRAGGLVGASEGGKIEKCSSSNNIEISNLNGKSIAGGLVGMVEFSEISNCYATGNVKTSSNRASTAGGLVGLIDATIAGTTIISKCYAIGSLDANATEKSSYAGGIVGNCEVLLGGTNGLIGDVTIKDCIYTGNKITAKGTYKAHGGAIISCIEGNSTQHTITIQNCNYLTGVTLNVSGITESKKNSQGKEYTNLNELINTISWGNEWKIVEGSLPSLQ